MKFYYCTDSISEDDPSIPKPPAYVRIQTLYLDLTIPASTPAAIINGWLSIPEPGTSPEYAGGIKLQLPQARISGRPHSEGRDSINSPLDEYFSTRLP